MDRFLKRCRFSFLHFVHLFHKQFHGNQCDVLIHINVHVPENIPAYDRIRAFEETCREYHVPYELNLNVSGDSYQELFEQMRVIFQDIDSKYSGQKKGIFLSNDTYANIFRSSVPQAVPW